MHPPPKAMRSVKYRWVDAFAENVKRQRRGVPTHYCDHLLRFIPSDHRKDGTEDLLLHHGAVERDIR